MMGLETLKAMNAEAARKARANGKEPQVVTCFEDARSIPFLGDACEDFDEQMDRVDTLFVDTSGWGADDEPALSTRQFEARIDELVAEHDEAHARLMKAAREAREAAQEGSDG